MFKVLDRLARHLRRVAPEGLLISEWSEIGADAIELVDGLRRRKDPNDARTVTRGLRAGDFGVEPAGFTNGLGENPSIPCFVTTLTMSHSGFSPLRGLAGAC